MQLHQATLVMRVSAYKLLHRTQKIDLMIQEVMRSMEWLINHLIKVGADVAYHGTRWQIHVASAFALAHHYRVRVKAHAQAREGVLRSNSGKRAAGPAQMWELEWLDHFRTCSQADSGVEIYRIAGFCPKKAGTYEIAE